MRFVVEDGELRVYAREEELAAGMNPPAKANGEVHVLTLPIQEGTNNEEIVESMAHGIAAVLEAGWRSPGAKVRDVVVITEHPQGEYSWLSLQRNGSCEGSNILDATLDLGVHFVINHEYREQQLGDWDYRALSPEDGFTLDVCQVLLEDLHVPQLFADSDLLREEDGENPPDPSPSFRDYEREAGLSTEELLQKLAAGEFRAENDEVRELYYDWLWSYDDHLREQWREAVLSHLGIELAILRRSLEDLDAERRRVADALDRLEELGSGAASPEGD